MSLDVALAVKRRGRSSKGGTDERDGYEGGEGREVGKVSEGEWESGRYGMWKGGRVEGKEASGWEGGRQ